MAEDNARGTNPASELPDLFRLVLGVGELLNLNTMSSRRIAHAWPQDSGTNLAIVPNNL